MEKYKAIFHVNESSKWGALLANINNLMKDLGKDNVVIEVVANGMAVTDYVVSDHNSVINKVEEAARDGVRFTACKNSLVGNSIAENAVPWFVKVVPAGVTELIKKQAEGYGYIKP